VTDPIKMRRLLALRTALRGKYFFRRDVPSLLRPHHELAWRLNGWKKREGFTPPPGIETRLLLHKPPSPSWTKNAKGTCPRGWLARRFKCSLHHRLVKFAPVNVWRTPRFPSKGFHLLVNRFIKKFRANGIDSFVPKNRWRVAHSRKLSPVSQPVKMRNNQLQPQVKSGFAPTA